jgi:hypothetical protein
MLRSTQLNSCIRTGKIRVLTKMIASDNTVSAGY